MNNLYEGRMSLVSLVTILFFFFFGRKCCFLRFHSVPIFFGFNRFSFRNRSCPKCLLETKTRMKKKPRDRKFSATFWHFFSKHSKLWPMMSFRFCFHARKKLEFKTRLSSNLALDNLNGLASGSAGQEEVEDSGLGHHVDRAGGQLILSGLLARVVVAAVKHRRPEHGGQVVEGHLVLDLELTDPDHVLDEEDDASLVGVVRDLREQVEER